MVARRFPSPWSVEELDACFIAKAEQKLALKADIAEVEPSTAF